MIFRLRHLAEGSPLQDAETSSLPADRYWERRPGPKGPAKEIIEAVLALKGRNPRFGFTRIAQQINEAFGTPINEDVVQRILATHKLPDAGDDGPS